MPDIIEKRKRVSDWLKTADEPEIDALLETIEHQEPGIYSKDLIRELDTRWDNYISGKSPAKLLGRIGQ